MSKLDNPTFKSIFAPYLINFIEYKKALGYKYEGETYALLRFDEMCMQEKLTDLFLSDDIIAKWIYQNNYESFHTQAQRKSIIKMFALYLNNYDVKAYLPITHPDNKKANNFVPYIFTHEQAALLLKNSHTTVKKRATSTMYIDFPLIMNILYGTGMRISEVLNIQIKDFDFDKGIITVKKSKFEKNRLIPVSKSLKSLFQVHYETVHSLSNEDDWLFSNIHHEKYHVRSIYPIFRKLLKYCRISHSDKGPRLHDLRHTFAVHSLQKLSNSGKDIYVTLPILCEYLGHSNLYSTEKYLRLTAEIFPEIAEKSNQIIREVSTSETY